MLFWCVLMKQSPPRTLMKLAKLEQGFKLGVIVQPQLQYVFVIIIYVYI